MTDDDLKIMMVVGEASGDRHGASLTAELRELTGGFSLFGLGGDYLAAEGMEVLHHVKDMGVIGITEVISSLRFFKRVFDDLVREAEKRRPDLAILVDYPDFNIRLGRKLKAMGIPIVYYISPQVWAWRKRRTKELARLVDLMIVIFPFEKDVYEKAGARAVFAGHPLADRPRPEKSREEICADLSLDPDERILLLLPGSRNREVETLLPVMLDSLPLMKSFPVQVVISRAETVEEGLIKGIAEGGDADVVISPSDIYNLLKCADAAAVAAGTASLETALAGTPAVVVYKLSPLTFIMAKLFVSVKYASMTNIVAGEKVFPELIQRDFNPRGLAAELDSVLTDEALRAEMKRKMSGIAENLKASGDNVSAAGAVYGLIEDRIL